MLDDEHVTGAQVVDSDMDRGRVHVRDPHGHRRAHEPGRAHQGLQALGEAVIAQVAES
jgi:hypothetical protein